MKNFNNLGVHEKIRFLGGLRKTSIWGGLPRKRRLGQFANLSGGEGLGKKEGVVFSRRG